MQPANLTLIHYSELQSGSVQERQRLFQACCDDGFFYLDFQGMRKDLASVVQQVYRLQKELFDLPLEEKLEYDIDKLSPLKLNGYKPLGRNHGEISGQKDGFESYALPKNEIMDLSSVSFSYPPCLNQYLPTLRTFCEAMSDLIHTILSSLSDSLQLGGKDRLEHKHRAKLFTPDLIRLLKYHAQPASEEGASHVPHTDLGSLSILFTEAPGLEVKRPGKSDWETVDPLSGRAVINIGDSLSMLTDGKLTSCLHRVSPPTLGQARPERYSFAYFSRAENDVQLRAVSSPVITSSAADMSREDSVPTSLEWIQQKYRALRADTWTDKNDTMLIRGR